jgi:hypothetical protein
MGSGKTFKLSFRVQVFRKKSAFSPGICEKTGPWLRSGWAGNPLFQQPLKLTLRSARS